MKKLFILAACTGFALLAGYACCIAAGNTSAHPPRRIQGNGHIVTRTAELAPFHAVEAERGVKVVLREGTAGTAEIAADANLMDYVELEVDEGTLYVGLNDKIQSASDMHVTVTVPTDGRLTSLEAHSGACIISQTTLTGTELELDTSSAGMIEVHAEVTSCKAEASSAGTISADLHTATCSADASSAAKIILTGRADRCRIDISSAARFKGSDFVVADCTVTASSAAKADVHCTDVLRADASSAAQVKYAGACTVCAQASSGAKIHKR